MHGKVRIWIVACTGVIVIGAGLAAYAIQAHRAARVAPGAVAVLELFTSEGCSSCPPADELLAQIIKESREKQSRVYALAFHVDSWNQANWSDPFSAAEYTRREEAYNKLGISDSVYTPQMIVNGFRVAIGSVGPLIHLQMEEALQTPAAIELKLLVQHSGDELVADVDLSTAPPSTLLNVALVERGLVNHVPKGENAGRTLRHENVVRAFKTVEVAQSHTTVKLAVPHDAIIGNCSVIAYAQDAKLKVLGATDAALPAASPVASSQP